LTGVTVLQAAVNGTTLCLLTTDLDSARQHLADIGGVVLGILDLGLAGAFEQKLTVSTKSGYAKFL
jgi:hypothetical protein